MSISEKSNRKWFVQSRNIVYYILGVIEVFLALRLIFKLLGASTTSSFVVFLYSITKVLIAPFIGIFKASAADGRFIFEPATVIAMIIYALIAKGIVSLINLRTANA